MRNFTLLQSTLLAGGLLLCSGAHAAYEGPGMAAAAVTIADVLKNPVEDQLVTLQGKLLRKTGKEEYLFSDGKNNITVEIDDKDLSHITVTEHSNVEITGEVDKKLLGEPEIDVKAIRLLNP